MKQLLLRGIFWRGLNYLTVFMVTIMIARLFQAGGSGVINYGMNNLALIILVAGMSLESGTGYYSARNEISQSQLAGISLVGAVFVMIVTLVCTLLVDVPVNTVLPAVLYCGGITLMNYFTALYYSHYRYLLPNIIVVVTNLVLLVIFASFPLQLTINEGRLFLWVYFISFFINGLVLCGTFIRQIAHGINFPSAVMMKKLYRYAGFAMLTNLVFFLVYRVDYWFVFRHSTAADLGNYIQVSKLGQIFMLIPGIIAGVIFTRTARSHSVNDIRELQQLSRVLGMFYLIVFGLIFILGRWLFPFVYGNSFQKMFVPFMILSPGIFSLSTLALITAFNAGRGKVKINFWGAVWSLMLIVTGNVIFTPKYGIYSAAAVSTLGYILYQFYVMYILKKEFIDLSVAAFFIPKKGDLSLFFRTDARQ